MLNIIRHGGVSRHAANKRDVGGVDDFGCVQFAGTGPAGPKKEVVLQRLLVERMKKMAGIGHQAHQRDRLAFQDDVAAEAFFVQIKRVEQDMHKTERVIAKREEKYFLHLLAWDDAPLGGVGWRFSND